MMLVDQALDRILTVIAANGPLPAEEISVLEAGGRILANDIIARRSQPPLAMSAMDGWAVRGEDAGPAGRILRQSGYVSAGHIHDQPVGAGEAVRIFTGAPMPPGADTVVLQENTRVLDDGGIELLEATRPGRNVRLPGIDFTAGSVGLTAGRRLTARDIGLAAAMNHPWLAVRRRPRVAILATGDEVVRPGEPIGPAQIVSSNSYALAALVKRWGGEPTLLGVARDDDGDLRQLAAGVRGADLLLTSGGASVGEHDLVKSSLAAIGLTLDFWKIAMRPGKPLMFGHLGAVPMLGLPGNPVSSMVCAFLFLRPLMMTLLGASAVHLPRQYLPLGQDMPANDSRQDFLRARRISQPDGTIVVPMASQDSSVMSVLAASDCLLIRPPHAPAQPAGTLAEILPLDDGADPA